MVMPKTIVDFEILKKWILDYNAEHGKPPRMEDYFRHLGAPYGKSVVLKEFGSLKNLYDEVGVTPRSEMEEAYKDFLLKELRNAVYKERVTNYAVLRKERLISRDRYVYERAFGSWKNAIRQSGIGPEERVLIRYFPDFKGEEPIPFLMKALGKGGFFTDKQKALIQRVQERELLTVKEMQKSIGYVAIKREFRYASVLQIAAGLVPSINYNTGIKYKAVDGHMCDSQIEMELDNWLCSNGYNHDVHVHYPESKMISDFKVDDLYIECAGLLNCGYDDYNEKIKKKVSYCLENDIRFFIAKDLKPKTLSKLRAALDGDIQRKDL